MAMRSKTAAIRPKVICLMQTSVDGKILIDRWPEPDAAENEYERVHDLHRADAWLCGRVTMAYFARTQHAPAEPKASKVESPLREKGDFIAGGAGSDTFAVAIDAAGKLPWKSNLVNGDRLIAVVTSRASHRYLAGLRAKNISYLIAGRAKIDLALALAKLRAHFGIKTLMLEGGGRINASFLHAGLIDELSLLLTPVIDGDSTTTSLFESNPGRLGLHARGLRLQKVVRRPSGILWLRYRVE